MGIIVSGKHSGENAVLEASHGTHEAPQLSSRNVGLTFAGVSLLIGVGPVLHGHPVRIWALALCIMLAAVALLIPRLLDPLAYIWTKVAAVMHVISTRVLMVVFFYAVVTPVAFCMRLGGRDHLRLRLDPKAKTYWQMRGQPQIEPQSFKNQF